jgi:uracil-DNA glycosylase
MTNQERLKLIQDKVTVCKKCKLCESRTNTVFAQGDPDFHN